MRLQPSPISMCAEREPALAAFYARWQNEALVVDKWLQVQSTSRLPGTAM